MIFDAGVFERRIGIGNALHITYLQTAVTRQLWIRNPTSDKSPIRSSGSVGDR
jgi:hypothetical protein